MDMNYLQGPRECHIYQKRLKDKAQKLSSEFWMASKKLFEESNKPVLKYISLVLDTKENISPSKIKKIKNRKSRPKKLRTYIPEENSNLSPSDLLKTDKNILLVGKPGIGKTTLAHEMLKIWAERNNKDLDYMFYFDKSATRHMMNLEDLLFSGYMDPDESKEVVLQDIKKNCDNITIIFDGVTDPYSSVLQKLVEKDLLPDAKIIIMCRPDDEDFFCGDFIRVEVKGFSEQTIKRYLSVTLGGQQSKVLNNVELFTLCHVPMYALMVAACCSSGDSPQQCTITEIYIEIVRLCFQMNSKKPNDKHLNSFITNKTKEILSLAEAAFQATEEKTLNLTDQPYEDRCLLSFLKPLVIRVARTETITTHAFLHYTVQEFFAALWLLRNPDKVRDVFQQCLTEEKKHMKHLIPFMCRLFNEKKTPSLMKCLRPSQEPQNTSDWFFKEMIDTFPCEQDDAGNSELGLNLQFLFQCLYESQCPEACIYLLEKLEYHLDLSEEILDPYCCCAVAYVVNQSKARKISLILENVEVPEKGMTLLFGCLGNVKWCVSLARQLWKIFLLSEEQMDHTRLLRLDEGKLQLPVEGERKLFERAVEVMKISTKVKVCLYWERERPVRQHLCETLLEALSYISSLSFQSMQHKDKVKFLGNLFCAAAEREQQTGEKTVELLSSVCSEEILTCDDYDLDDDDDNDDEKALKFKSLLDLYSHVKDYETKTGLSVLPLLQSVFQSTPSDWFIDLSQINPAILLEMLKLQPEKKRVKLTGVSHTESEVRTFLQCLSHISQLRLGYIIFWGNKVKFLGNLFCAAAEREQQTGEKTVELLSSVCSEGIFNITEQDYDDDDYKALHFCFLLDFYSHCLTKTGLSVLPLLQSVFQSTPSDWFIDLSKINPSILLEMLKLQPEKKRVKLTGVSHTESEVRTFLQCLSHISHLSCGPEFFQTVCTSIFVSCREEVQQLVSLLRLVNISLLLTGELPRKTCLSVGRVLRVCSSNVDFILTPRKMSVRGASNLFRDITQLHSLRLSSDMVLLLCQWIRRGRGNVLCLLTIEELSLAPKEVALPQRGWLRVVSSLACLLRHWTVRHLDLTDFYVSAQSVIPLLLHDGPLTLKLRKDDFQQLLELVCEVQDKDFTCCFLKKVGGDLTSCFPNWEILHHFLQSSPLTITVSLRKNNFLPENIVCLLQFLDRVVFARSSSSFVLTTIREIYKSRTSQIIPILLRSLNNVINLTCRELDTADCDALHFILTHSSRVKLNLLWTLIPTEKLELIFLTLGRVSQLSVDRKLLLRFIHYCTASDIQQEAVLGLIRTLQHRVDLSCSSCVELQDETYTMRLTSEDCRAICSVLRHSSQDVQLNLRDCEVEDSGLDLIFDVLHRVKLRVSQGVLLQLLSLVNQRDSVRRVESLCGSLERKLDLSHTTLDERICVDLSLVLDFSEGMTELDLSHCELTDHLLFTIIRHLHKVEVLDLSHNKITDASTDSLMQLVSINPTSIITVRLFGNNIKDKSAFKKPQVFEIW